MPKLKIRIIKEGNLVFPNDCQRMYMTGEFYLGKLNDFIKNDLMEEFGNFKDGEYRCHLDLGELEGHYDLKAKTVEKIPSETIVECPRCGAAQEDFDGFGVLHCPDCGFCVHPSFTDGRCNFCGDL